MHLRELSAWYLQSTRRRPGSEHQLGEAQAASTSGLDLSGMQVDGGDGRPEQDVDLVRDVEALGMDPRRSWGAAANEHGLLTAVVARTAGAVQRRRAPW